MVFGAHLLSCKLRIEGPVFGEDKWSGVGMVRQWAALQGQAKCFHLAPYGHGDGHGDPMVRTKCGQVQGFS